MSDITLNFSELKAKADASSPAKNRLTYLFDDKKFTELNALALSGGDLSGVVTAFGCVNNSYVYAFSQDSSVKNGAMTAAGADKISKLFDLAAKTGLPVVGIYDSYGADISNGFEAMNSYGELLRKAANLSGVVPQIAVVAGSCTGMAAMMAASADFAVMTKDAEIFVSPNCGKNSAENAAENGLVVSVEDDENKALDFAKKLLEKLPQNNLEPVPEYEFENPSSAFGLTFEKITASVCDKGSAVELSSEYGTAACTALASIEGTTVGIISTSNADKLSADDCSKIARFVRTLDAFAIPVVTFVDTKGFETSNGCESADAVKAMTRLANSYSEATTAKIAVVTSKAYGSAFTALAGKGANADIVFALPNAVISALDPVAAVEFLEHEKLAGASDLTAERNKLADEYAKAHASAVAAAANRAVDAIVEETQVREALSAALNMLAGKRETTLPKKHSNMPL